MHLREFFPIIALYLALGNSLPANCKKKEVKTKMLFIPREKGQGLVEYALILVLVAVVVIVILALLGPAIGNVFSNIIANI